MLKSTNKKTLRKQEARLQMPEVGLYRNYINIRLSSKVLNLDKK